MKPGRADGYSRFLLGHNWSETWNIPSKRSCHFFGICIFVSYFCVITKTRPEYLEKILLSIPVIPGCRFSFC